MVAALGGDRVGQDRAQRLRLGRAATRAGACGDKAGEQVVHLADRAAQSRDHVGAEFGIVGVALGIARRPATIG